MSDHIYADLVTAFAAATAAKDTSPAAFDHWLDLGRALAAARGDRQDASWHTHLGDKYPCPQFERGQDEGLL